MNRLWLLAAAFWVLVAMWCAAVVMYDVWRGSVTWVTCMNGAFVGLDAWLAYSYIKKIVRDKR